MSRYYRDPTTGNEMPIAGMRDVQDVKNLMLELCYPIGSMYMSTVNVSPETFLGGTWISHSGYILRGATTGVSSNRQQKDGGSDDLVVPYHNHSFTGSAVNTGGSTATNTGTQSADHTHTVNGGASSTGWMKHNNPHSHNFTSYNSGAALNGSGGQYNPLFTQAGTSTSTTHGTDINHTHSQVDHTHSVSANSVGHTHNMAHTHSVTAAGTVGYAGTNGNTANANIPNYKNVYIWERTA